LKEEVVQPTTKKEVVLACSAVKCDDNKRRRGATSGESMVMQGERRQGSEGGERSDLIAVRSVGVKFLRGTLCLRRRGALRWLSS